MASGAVVGTAVAPVACGDRPAGAVDPGAGDVRPLSAGPGRGPRPATLRREPARTVVRTGGTSTSTPSVVDRVPERAAGHGQVRADHGAARAALGIGLAMLAAGTLLGIGVFRTDFSSTVATSVAVASLMWFFLLQPDVGALAERRMAQRDLPHAQAARACCATATPPCCRSPCRACGRASGSRSSSSPPGCSPIPADLHEAAAIDGATGTTRFWRITLPLLGPTLLFVVIVLTTRAFQAYGEIDLLTDGGPQPGDVDHHADLSHLRLELDHRRRRRSPGHHGRAAVPRAARAVDVPAPTLGKRVHYGGD